MSNHMNLSNWDKRCNYVRNKYAQLTKSEKGNFLATLLGKYEIRTSTICAKLSGRLKMNPVEIYVVELEIDEYTKKLKAL